MNSSCHISIPCPSGEFHPDAWMATSCYGFRKRCKQISFTWNNFCDQTHAQLRTYFFPKHGFCLSAVKSLSHSELNKNWKCVKQCSVSTFKLATIFTSDAKRRVVHGNGKPFCVSRFHYSLQQMTPTVVEKITGLEGDAWKRWFLQPISGAVTTWKYVNIVFGKQKCYVTSRRGSITDGGSSEADGRVPYVNVHWALQASHEVSRWRRRWRLGQWVENEVHSCSQCCKKAQSNELIPCAMGLIVDWVTPLPGCGFMASGFTELCVPVSFVFSYTVLFLDKNFKQVTDTKITSWKTVGATVLAEWRKHTNIRTWLKTSVSHEMDCVRREAAPAHWTRQRPLHRPCLSHSPAVRLTCTGMGHFSLAVRSLLVSLFPQNCHWRNLFHSFLKNKTQCSFNFFCLSRLCWLDQFGMSVLNIHPDNTVLFRSFSN